MTRLLAFIPSPPQGVWHLGPVPIRAYALFIIAGIVVCLVIGDRRWEARGGRRGVIYDIALWAVPFGLLGGRLYHLATDWRTYWGPGGAGLGAAVRIWDGGLGIWGAVALGGVGAWIACRRRDIPLPAFGDAIAPGIILAQAIGRLGNYFNQELYGRETTLPWGLEIFYRRDPSGYVDPHSLDGVSTGQLAYVVHPTFLYELLWNLLVFVVLIYVDRRFRFGHGRLFALYVAAYCVGRFGVELLRDDTATHIAGIRINVFTSTFVFIGAVVYIILAPKGREDPESLRGRYVDEDSYPPEPAPEPAEAAAAEPAVGEAETTEVEAAPDPDEGAELAEAAEPGAEETDTATVEEAAEADEGTEVIESAPDADEGAAGEDAAAPAAADTEPAVEEEPEQEPEISAEEQPEAAEAAGDEPETEEPETEEPEAESEAGEESERDEAERDEAEEPEKAEEREKAEEPEKAAGPEKDEGPEKSDVKPDGDEPKAVELTTSTGVEDTTSPDAPAAKRRLGFRLGRRGR